MTRQESSDNFGQQLREMFPDGAVMDLAPLLRSLENDGRIHSISCEEAIISVLLDLKNKGTKESFSDTWNVVSHIESCVCRSCTLLRTPSHMTKYLYPEEDELKVLISDVRNAYAFDCEKDGKAKNREEGGEMFDKLIDSLK